MKCVIPKLAVAWLALLLLVPAVLAGEYTVDIGVVYGKTPSQDLRADLYLPAGLADDARVPAVILVHGGAWARGSRAGFVEVTIGQRLAKEGMVAMSIDYRLVRDGENGQILNQWPAAIDDCRQAVRWLREHAAKYHVDPERIGALGGSAGGHLVSLLGTTDVAGPGETSTRVQAVVDVFGPADLLGDFTHIPYGGGSAQVLIDRFVGKGNDANKKAASPIRHIDQQTPPFLIFHGSDDPLVPVDQSRRFHAALEQAGRSSEYIEYTGERHSLSPKNFEDALQRSIDFFKTTLGRS